MQKLADHVKKKQLVMPLALLDEIREWRRHQPDLARVSPAIRRLIEAGLKASSTGDKPKPKRKG